MAILPPSEQYRVHLPIFEGPLDLLLFFIKRDEVDIYDIPIAHITRDFLDYINLMKSLNIRLAGDFMVMAATLMRIKARVLLPSLPFEEDEIEDPREELVQMLIEYRRFKQVATEFAEMESDSIKVFPRRHTMESMYGGPTLEDSLIDVTLYDLMSIVKRTLSNIPEEIPHQVELFDVTIEEQMGLILSYFGEKSEYTFAELMKTLSTKIVVIVTFLAILELMKKGKIRIAQSEYFGEIVIRKR